MTTRARRRANNGSAYATAANGAAPRLVTMAELDDMRTDLHGSRTERLNDRDLLLLGCRCVAFAMRSAA